MQNENLSEKFVEGIVSELKGKFPEFEIIDWKGCPKGRAPRGFNWHHPDISGLPRGSFCFVSFCQDEKDKIHVVGRTAGDFVNSSGPEIRATRYERHIIIDLKRPTSVCKDKKQVKEEHDYASEQETIIGDFLLDKYKIVKEFGHRRY